MVVPGVGILVCGALGGVLVGRGGGGVLGVLLSCVVVGPDVCVELGVSRGGDRVGIGGAAESWVASSSLP